MKNFICEHLPILFKKSSFFLTGKCPLHGLILVPPEGVCARRYLGSTPVIDQRSQGVIPRQFKQNQNF